MSDLVGVILAGGSSRRMGEDKSSLKLGDVTLLEHAQMLLMKAGINNIAVLGRPEHPCGIADQMPGGGPADALFHYLTTTPEGQKNIIIPVDMPALTPELLLGLTTQGKWAYYECNLLPLFAVSGPIKRPQSARLADLLLQEGAGKIPLPATANENNFSNLNTQADWLRWKEKAG